MNYIINVGNRYCGQSVFLSVLLDKELTDAPASTKAIFEFILANFQKINQQKETSYDAKTYKTSLRELSETTKINKTTIQRAINYLRDKGWLNVDVNKGSGKSTYTPNYKRINKKLKSEYNVT